MINLTENEKDKFIELEDKDGEELLSPEERMLEDKLKNCIVTGVPLDRNHEALQTSLSPVQEEQYLKYEAKKDKGDELNHDEKNQLNSLQELLKSGIPIDGRHPGQENLTPLQQDTFVSLLDKSRNSGLLVPEEEKSLKRLKTQMVHGERLDTDHSGMSHLTPG